MYFPGRVQRRLPVRTSCRLPVQCHTFKSFLGKVYSFLLPHDTYRRKGEAKMWWQIAPLSGTCCKTQPWFSVAFSSPHVITCWNRTSEHRNKCGDQNMRPEDLNGVTAQASKDRLDHWNLTLIHTWTISRSGLVQLWINQLFITRTNVLLLCAGNKTSFRVYCSKVMPLISVCVLPVLCLVLRANRITKSQNHFAAMELKK